MTIQRDRQRRQRSARADAAIALCNALAAAQPSGAPLRQTNPRRDHRRLRRPRHPPPLPRAAPEPRTRQRPAQQLLGRLRRTAQRPTPRHRGQAGEPSSRPRTHPRPHPDQRARPGRRGRPRTQRLRPALRPHPSTRRRPNPQRRTRHRARRKRPAQQHHRRPGHGPRAVPATPDQDHPPRHPGAEATDLLRPRLDGPATPQPRRARPDGTRHAADTFAARRPIQQMDRPSVPASSASYATSTETPRTTQPRTPPATRSRRPAPAPTPRGRTRLAGATRIDCSRPGRPPAGRGTAGRLDHRRPRPHRSAETPAPTCPPSATRSAPPHRPRRRRDGLADVWATASWSTPRPAPRHR